MARMYSVFLECYKDTMRINAKAKLPRGPQAHLAGVYSGFLGMKPTGALLLLDGMLVHHRFLSKNHLQVWFY